MKDSDISTSGADVNETMGQRSSSKIKQKQGFQSFKKDPKNLIHIIYYNHDKKNTMFIVVLRL